MGIRKLAQLSSEEGYTSAEQEAYRLGVHDDELLDELFDRERDMDYRDSWGSYASSMD